MKMLFVLWADWSMSQSLRGLSDDPRAVWKWQKALQGRHYAGCIDLQNLIEKQNASSADEACFVSKELSRWIFRRNRYRYALVDGHKVPLPMPCVDLTRASDLLLRILHQLFPLGQPTSRPRNRKQHREHLRPEAHSLIHDPRVEVDVWIQLALHEIVVFQRDPLQFQSDVEFRIATRHFKYLLRTPADDFGPRIVILVNTVSEAHELEVAVLHALDVGGNVVFRPNLVEHSQDFLVRSAMQGTRQR